MLDERKEFQDLTAKYPAFCNANPEAAYDAKEYMEFLARIVLFDRKFDTLCEDSTERETLCNYLFHYLCASDDKKESDFLTKLDSKQQEWIQEFNTRAAEECPKVTDLSIAENFPEIIASARKLGPHAGRIRQAVGKENFVGLKRALTILARGILFDEEIGKIGSSNSEKAALCKYLLNLWCGFDAKIPAFLTAENETALEKYIREHNIRNQLESYTNYMDTIAKFLNSKQTWNRIYQKVVHNSRKQKDFNSSFNEEYSNIINSTDTSYYENAIRFYKIIGTAFDLGPLQEYCLACKKDLLGVAWVISNDAFTLLKKATGKTLQRREEFQKYVAYICLNRYLKRYTNVASEDLPQETAYITRSDIYTWSSSTVSRTSDYRNRYVMNTSIHMRDYIIHKNGLNHTFNKIWENDFAPRIISVEDKEELQRLKKDGYILYYDNGYGRELRSE